MDARGREVPAPPSGASAVERGDLPAPGVTAWGAPAALLLAALVLAGLWLRLRGLAAEGFADDEIHKWLAALRYLRGDFGGDDLEHPMLMKALIAAAVGLAPAGSAPEALTRLPNALSGGALIVAVAWLGRRLCGRAAGLFAAALVALSPTAVGYGRIAKEDVLLALFTTVLVLCLAEARAAAEEGREPDARRWELWGAAALAGMFASKYLVAVFPLPLVAYAWLRAGGSRWRVPARRWLLLAALSAALFLLLDPVLLLPSTWSYLRDYVGGKPLGDRGKSESLLFLGTLYDNLVFHWRGGVPAWFHLAFAAAKLAPPTALLAALGLGLALWRRRAGDRLLLAWIGVFLLVYAVGSAKYGRYFLPILPAFALLAAQGAVALARRIPRPALAGPALAAIALLASGTEAAASLRLGPHPRLYVSALAGGDAAVDRLFPHCDYFDAGVREAVEAVAARAEPGARLASDTPWLTRWYAERAGRPDLAGGRILPGQTCGGAPVCYLLVSPGRRYRHNQEVLDRLAPRVPWAAVDLGGHTAVRVYRVEAEPAPPAAAAHHW